MANIAWVYDEGLEKKKDQFLVRYRGKQVCYITLYPAEEPDEIDMYVMTDYNEAHIDYAINLHPGNTQVEVFKLTRYGEEA